MGLEANITESDAATPAIAEIGLLPFSFPAVGRKKVAAAFHSRRMTSVGRVMLLTTAEGAFGIADRLALLITDPRNPLLATHSVADILRARMLAIACGCEDADHSENRAPCSECRLCVGPVNKMRQGWVPVRR